MRIAALLAVASLWISLHSCCAADRPHIVWIVVDDMSCHFGYQGETLVDTPHVDRLAREGVVFNQAYATAPVCSTFRSAMITSMYQTTIGSHHHRSGRGKLKIHLPENVRTIPELFREAGYYTSISNAAGDRIGKQDYNFEYAVEDLYNGTDYRDRAAGQPFFAQYHLRGGKLRNVPASYVETRKGLNEQLVDPAIVSLPPYYPDHPVVRDDWAAYLDSVNYTDVEVGRILARLKSDNVLKDCVVFFLTDHGISHARGKQFLYEEGIKIPFVAWGPQWLKQPAVREDLIAHIDLGATSLHLAGIDIPDSMQGRAMFAQDHQARTFVVSARDRCDETVDRIRSVRSGSFKYIRNYFPDRPYLQPCRYKDAKPFMPVLRELDAAGKLDPIQSLHMASTRPPEELYDLRTDPWEVNNLATNADYQAQLALMQSQLSDWIKASGDLGQIDEPDTMFDSDMDVYLNKNRQRNPEGAAELERNIALMKRWKSEGK